MSVTFTAPPNHRASQSCGTCTHWDWDYEGEGTCTKYPETVSIPMDSFKQIYEDCRSTNLCDDWAKNEEVPTPPEDGT